MNDMNNEQRTQIAAACLQGLLVSETADTRAAATYVDDKGYETRADCHFTLDARTTFPNRFLRTAEQNRARWVVQQADALMAELARTAKAVEPAPRADVANLIKASNELVDTTQVIMHQLNMLDVNESGAYGKLFKAVRSVNEALSQFPPSGGQ
jgi:hypothetical protein